MTILQQMRGVLQGLEAQRAGLVSTMEAVYAQAQTAEGEQRAQLVAQFDGKRAEIERLDGEIDAQEARIADQEKIEERAAKHAASAANSAGVSGREYRVGGLSTAARPEPGSWIRAADGLPAVAEPGRFAEHPIVRSESQRMSQQEQSVIGQHGGIGNLIRSMSTSSGSAIVPTLWASDIIDLARQHAAVLKAGAQVVPMNAKTVEIGRLTADPTAAFRSEGSTVTASDPTFDNVTLTATTLSALVVGSLEWFQDAANVDQVVEDAIAKAIALAIDEAALFGGLETGDEGFSLASPPSPDGVLSALLADASSSVLGSATNGTTQTATSYWDEILDLIFTVRDFNEEPNAILWNSKAARQYAKAYDTTGQPLQIPADVTALQRIVTNQIPSFTSGTMTDRSTDVFAGDWSQLLIGQRLGLTIQTLTERYAELGQIGIVAHWRGDVQLARPRAFAVYRYLQGSA
jgi:HK97 family phage major capsid protein